jgi:uridylate kinase
VLSRKLRIMDLTAITLCMEHGMPIIVFDLNVTGNIYKAVQGKKIGTFIRG